MKSLDWIGISQIGAFILILTRISGVFIAAPLLGNRSVPDRVKLPLVIMLSFLLYPAVTHGKALVVSSHIQLLTYIFEELTIGLTIGFVASFLFSAVQIAGEIFGMQIGYSIATILDPTNQADEGVLTTLYTALAALFFLYLNGHHLILGSLAKSFEIIPISHGFNMTVGFGISHLVEKFLLLAIQLASPVLIVVTVLNMIFGLISKVSPQMNIYFNVGFIVGPILGIGVLILSLPLFRMLLMHMTEDLGPDLLKTIQELKAI
ncbi:MAG: flagellar biosynthetic protein FliR [Bacteriovoracaceae bacterium]|nr:flagellar biosynthetic protein FliR [Bacteriovoracaceae bacterium]